MLASYLRRAATPIDTAAPRPSPTYLSILLVCINDLQARNCKFMLRKVEKDNKNNLWNIYSGFLRWAGCGSSGIRVDMWKLPGRAIIIAIMATSTYAY